MPTLSFTVQKQSHLSAAILRLWCNLEQVFAATGSNTKHFLAIALPHFFWGGKSQKDNKECAAVSGNTDLSNNKLSSNSG